MAQTAKSIQLTDENGVNISPITNLESIYYETLKENIVYRNYIYSNFPVHTNISTNCEIVEVDNYDSDIININSNQKLQIQNSDIYISCINMHRLEGTAYHSLDISNYNLSNLLFNYASKQQLYDVTEIINTSIAEVSSYLHNDINNDINNIYENEKEFEKQFMDISIFEYNDLSSKIQNTELIPNTLYELNYYFDNNNVNESPFYLVLLANSSTSFSKNVVATPKKSSILNNETYNLIVEYDFDSNKIIYMKDEYNNSAKYDFINCITFINDYKENKYSNKFKNNTIDTSVNYYGFISDILIKENNDDIICNNYIGAENTNILIDGFNNTIQNKCSNIEIHGNNNTIDSSNSSIYIYSNDNTIAVQCSSIYINKNSNIVGNINSSININSENNYIYDNNSSIIIIENCSNNIIKNNNENIIINSANSIIDSSNSDISTNGTNTKYNYLTIGSYNKNITYNGNNIVINSSNSDISINSNNCIIGNNNANIKIYIKNDNVTIYNGNSNIIVKGNSTVTTANNTIIYNECSDISINGYNNILYNNISNVSVGNNVIIYSNNSSLHTVEILDNCIIGNNIIDSIDEHIEQNTYYSNNTFYAKEYIKKI